MIPYVLSLGFFNGKRDSFLKDCEKPKNWVKPKECDRDERETVSLNRSKCLLDKLKTLLCVRWEAQIRLEEEDSGGDDKLWDEETGFAELEKGFAELEKQFSNRQKLKKVISDLDTKEMEELKKEFQNLEKLHIELEKGLRGLDTLNEEINLKIKLVKVSKKNKIKGQVY